MSTSPHPLTPRQEQSITALLVQESLQAAAEARGLNEQTLRRLAARGYRVSDGDRDARRAVVQHAITQVQRATGAAVETLHNVMQDAAAPASARVSAAQAMLETAVTSLDIADLAARMAPLEAQVPPR